MGKTKYTVIRKFYNEKRLETNDRVLVRHDFKL